MLIFVQRRRDQPMEIQNRNETIIFIMVESFFIHLFYSLNRKTGHTQEEEILVTSCPLGYSGILFAVCAVMP
jgi:hypothetical protein